MFSVKITIFLYTAAIWQNLMCIRAYKNTVLWKLGSFHVTVVYKTPFIRQ